MPQSDLNTPHLLADLITERRHPAEINATQWDELITCALTHKLAPMLAWILKRISFSLPADSLQAAHLYRARQLNALHCMVWQSALVEINDAFLQANVPTLWLKGSALALTVYPDAALRPMADLDVLVPYEKREQALKIAQANGYQFYHPPTELLRADDELVLKRTHHYHLRGGSGDSIYLEIHFRLLGVDGEKLLPYGELQWFWEQTVSIPSPINAVQSHQPVSFLSPEAHLLYLCAHAILQHGEAAFILMRYFDLHLLISKSKINWELVVEQATHLKWTLAVERGLSNTTAYFQTPIPDEILNQLRQRRPPDEDILRVIQLQTGDREWQHSVNQLKALSWKGRFRIVRLVLFPPQSYMRQRYGLSINQKIWRYYFYRWIDQGRRIVAGLRR